MALAPIPAPQGQIYPSPFLDPNHWKEMNFRQVVENMDELASSVSILARNKFVKLENSGEEEFRLEETRTQGQEYRLDAMDRGKAITKEEFECGFRRLDELIREISPLTQKYAGKPIRLTRVGEAINKLDYAPIIFELLENALIEAASQGNLPDVQALLKAGANGDRALIKAAIYGHTEIVEELLRAGANINAQNQEGDTALMLTALCGNRAMVDMLIKAGAKLNLQNEKGNTALMIAGSYGHSPIVDMLLKAGAQVDIKNREGDTALMLAQKKHHANSEGLLKKAEEEHRKKLNFLRLEMEEAERITKPAPDLSSVNIAFSTSREKIPPPPMPFDSIDNENL